MGILSVATSSSRRTDPALPSATAVGEPHNTAAAIVAFAYRMTNKSFMKTAWFRSGSFFQMHIGDDRITSGNIASRWPISTVLRSNNTGVKHDTEYIEFKFAGVNGFSQRNLY